jgi:hypothetical protein
MPHSKQTEIRVITKKEVDEDRAIILQGNQSPKHTNTVGKGG